MEDRTHVAHNRLCVKALTTTLTSVELATDQTNRYSDYDRLALSMCSFLIRSHQ